MLTADIKVRSQNHFIDACIGRENSMAYNYSLTQSLGEAYYSSIRFKVMNNNMSGFTAHLPHE